MINDIQSYTWETPKGSFTASFEKGDCKFRLITQNNTVDIPQEKIYGTSLNVQSQKTNEFFQQYLPVIKKERDTGAYSVTFYLSACPEEIEVAESNQDSEYGEKSFSFGFSMNKLNSVHYVSFSDKAPYYRRVVRGLNLEGTCENEGCDAYQKKVIVPVGIGKFNISAQKNHADCTACDQTLESDNITNLGFWNCNYEIEGKRSDKEEISRKDSASSEKYKTFQPGDDCVWQYLDITTSLSEQSSALPNKDDRCVLF